MLSRLSIFIAGLMLLLLSYSASIMDDVYALVPGPSANINLEPPFQNISALGSAVYNLTIDMGIDRGWEGWIDLTLGDLPEGVTAKMIDAIYVKQDEWEIITPIYVTVTPFVKSSQITLSVTAISSINNDLMNSSTYAQLNVVSSVTTSTVTEIRTRTLADKTLTLTILSTTTIYETVSTTLTDTKTVIDNNVIMSEIESLLENRSENIQPVSIGIGIAIAGVAIALALRKRA